MFRTVRDHELKQRDAEGSPFFNLRDTIFIILKHHVDKPKVCKELQLTREASAVFSVVLYLK